MHNYLKKAIDNILVLFFKSNDSLRDSEYMIIATHLISDFYHNPNPQNRFSNYQSPLPLWILLILFTAGEEYGGLPPYSAAANKPPHSEHKGEIMGNRKEGTGEN